MTDRWQVGGPSPARRPQPPRLDAVGLLEGAFGQVMALWAPALGLLAAGAAIHWTTRAASQALGPLARMPGFLPLHPDGNLAGYLTFLVVSALANATLYALMLRLFLTPATAWWRPDRNLAAAAGIVALANLALTAFDLAAPVSPTFAPGTMLARSGLLLTGMVAQAIICSYLALWPAGAALGDREMTPMRSARLMGGHVVSLIGANLVLQIPFFLLVVVSAFLMRDALRETMQIQRVVILILGPAASIVSWAMVARLYGALAASTAMRSPGASTNR